MRLQKRKQLVQVFQRSQDLQPELQRQGRQPLQEPMQQVQLQLQEAALLQQPKVHRRLQLAVLQPQQ